MFNGENGKINFSKYYATIQGITGNVFTKVSSFSKENAAGGTSGICTFDREGAESAIKRGADKIWEEGKKLSDALVGIQRVVNETFQYATERKRNREEQIMRALAIQSPNASKVSGQRNVAKESTKQTVLDAKTKLCDNYTSAWFRNVDCATTTFERADFVKDEPRTRNTFQSVGKFFANCLDSVKGKIFSQNCSASEAVGDYVQRFLTLDNPSHLKPPLDDLETVHEINQHAKESLQNLNKKMGHKVSTYLRSTQRQIQSAIEEMKRISEDSLKIVSVGADSNTLRAAFPHFDQWQALTVNNEYVSAIVESQKKLENNLKELNETSSSALRGSRKDFKRTTSNATKELDELTSRLETLGSSLNVSLADVRSSVLSLYDEVEEFGVECKNVLNDCKEKACEKTKTLTEKYKCHVIEIRDKVIDCGKAELVRHICKVNRKLEQRETETEEEKRLDDPIQALQKTMSICKTQLDETRELKNKLLSKVKEGACAYAGEYQGKLLEGVKDLKDRVDGVVKSASAQIESVMEDVSAVGGCIRQEIEAVVGKAQGEFEVVKQKTVEVKEKVNQKIEGYMKQFYAELEDAKRKAELHYDDLNQRVQKIRENFQKGWEQCKEERKKDANECDSRTKKRKD